ncbi:MAG: hypothetical protein ACM3N0_13080 [Chloroflexota bacterium]
MLIKSQGATERVILGCILLGSIIFGGVMMFTSVPDDYLLPLLASPLVAAAAGLAVARATGRVDLRRALLTSLAGGAFVPWGWFIVFYASIVIGSGCLD